MSIRGDCQYCGKVHDTSHICPEMFGAHAQPFASPPSRSHALLSRVDALLLDLTHQLAEPDYDYPGDAPVLCGYVCRHCRASDSAMSGIEHRDDCIVTRIKAALTQSEIMPIPHGAQAPTEKAGSTPARSQRSGETGGRFDSGVVDSGEPKARPASGVRSSAESGDQSSSHDKVHQSTPRCDALHKRNASSGVYFMADWVALAESLERELAEMTALKLPAGAECKECGFRYSEYNGHIIPCPRCTPSAVEASEINQCDGCRRRLPLGSNGIHYNHSGSGAHPVMGCTADRYTRSHVAQGEPQRWAWDHDRHTRDPRGEWVLYDDVKHLFQSASGTNCAICGETFLRQPSTGAKK